MSKVYRVYTGLGGNDFAAEGPPADADGAPVRLAARQHKYAHAQAAALRRLFPLLPAEERQGAGRDPVEWLVSQHNLSAALLELDKRPPNGG